MALLSLRAYLGIATCEEPAMSLLDKIAHALNPGDALPGRPNPIPTSDLSFVNGRPLHPP